MAVPPSRSDESVKHYGESSSSSPFSPGVPVTATLEILQQQLDSCLSTRKRLQRELNSADDYSRSTERTLERLESETAKMNQEWDDCKKAKKDAALFYEKLEKQKLDYEAQVAKLTTNLQSLNERKEKCQSSKYKPNF